MSVAPVPLPNVQLLYGPMLVGVFLNLILYGVLLGQTLNYFQVYKRDPTWMRLFVGYLFAVSTANSVLAMHMMYEPLIIGYGQKPVFFPTVFMSESLCVVLVSMPIQVFFAWRIYQLTKSPWVPVLIAFTAIASFGGGVWTTVMVHVLKLFAKKPLLHQPALVWFLTSCVADVLITVSLVWTLTGKKTGFSATDSVVDKIIRATIQTGLITAIFIILEVVCFMLLPHYAINFVFDLALSKLYVNCLMSTLNARQSIQHTDNPSTFQQRNVMLSPSRGMLGKQETFFDTSGPVGSMYDGREDRHIDDLEYGIHMTKVVERIEDPLPRGERR
ncbi:hypothetical protein MVEN_01983600 [Mycena venus]|uniref:DUF6534 domain-containing protein n=1 Tax=Mycena venus TaxID=2733690 RepID=A0A8H7CK91_9AGAR|nr:hypothetical protein MVEN_01983600 [Mycena venus]